MAMKSKLTAGEYEIEIGGKTHTLKPTLAAFTRLAALGSYNDISARIFNRDAGIIAVVIRHGLGWKDAEAKRLSDFMMKAGTHTLWEPCYRYFFALFHAGKTIEEIAAENEAKAAEGGAVESDGDDEGNGLTGA